MQRHEFKKLCSAWKQQRGAKKEVCFAMSHWIYIHSWWDFSRVRRYIHHETERLRIEKLQAVYLLETQEAQEMRIEQHMAAWQWLLEQMVEDVV